jgi:steroid delta-isomerase-like uncharacterized protein
MHFGRRFAVSKELIDAAWAPNDAFNRGDWAAFEASLAPDAVYEEVTTGRRTEGARANLELAKGWKSAFPDVTGTADASYASGDTVIFEITWNGTHTGPLPLPNGGELPPTGKPVAVKAVMVTTVRDGKSAHQRHYLDMLGMLTQLGVIPS